jgi:protein-S-isoprenylcysteine O-methyltransferase Ste14
MDPLPFADGRASLAFSIAVGLFAVLQAASGVVATVRRLRAGAGHTRLDRGTLPLVLLFTGAGVMGAVLSATRITGATIGASHPAVRWLVFDLGIVVILAGAALRLWAIVTLGRWFTYDVRVTEGQPVVTTGPYRWLRHPSYTGILLLLLGMGLAFGNWLAILCLVVLSGIGLVLRIRVEEAALQASFGAAYDDYAATRPHLVPGLW